MIAALPMYDLPGLTRAHDALWDGIRDDLRRHGFAAPERLDRSIDIWAGWQSPRLLLGQICGLPLRARMRGRVHLVGTLDYGLPDTPPGFYRSAIVTRRGDSERLTDYEVRRLAINDPLSHSGWGAAHATAARAGFAFSHVRDFGAHGASLGAVLAGDADIAFVDEISLRGLLRADPASRAAIQIIGRSDPSPGQALITADSEMVLPLRHAIATAIHNLPDTVRRDLGVRGMVDIPAARYFSEPIPPAPPLIAFGDDLRPYRAITAEGVTG